MGRLVVLLALASTACGTEVVVDAGAPPDAGSDAAVGDAGADAASPRVDAGPPDAGPPPVDGGFDGGLDDGGLDDGGLDDGGLDDGGSDGGADGGLVTGCDPTAPFGTPTPVLGMSTTEDEREGTLSGDELEVYVTRRVGSGRRLVRGTRPDRASAFGGWTEVMLSDPGPFISATLSVDDLTLYIDVNGGGSIFHDIFIVRRPDTASAFADPVLPTAATNAQLPAVHPGELYFWRSSFIYYMPLDAAGEPYGTPSRIGSLSSPIFPVVSADGLTLYYAQGTSGGPGGYDIHRLIRPDTATPFRRTPGVPTLVPELSTAQNEHPAALSRDQCRLYLWRDTMTLTGDDWFVAERTP